MAIKQKLTRAEAVEKCRQAQIDIADIKQSPDVQRFIGSMGLLGESVGYTPAFRALIMDTEPEGSVKWVD